MSKLVAFATYNRFRSALDNNNINEYSLNFIVNTGQLYTHGILFNSVTFGAESNGGVPLTIAGVTKTLALSSHTHSAYLEKNSNIDIGNYKIVSGNTDLLYLDSNGINIGNSNTSTYIKGPAYRDSYTILDTGNFSITELTLNGRSLSNVALFTYGSTKFQLDYVKRVNATSVFDNLTSYTCLGTTNVDLKNYGFVTFYTSEGTLNSPWALLRININDKVLEYRTSLSTSWVNVTTPVLPVNALNTAGIVTAPDLTTRNKVWKTDSNGNPGWREETYSSFHDLLFLGVSGTNLMVYNSQATKTVVAGTNISFTYSDDVLTINSLTFTDTWRSIYVNQVSKLGTSITTKALNFKAAGGITLTYTAAGENDNYSTLQISSTTYSTATPSALGLVKVGDTLTDLTGYTACKIKDGVIYYKDTNTTYNIFTGADTNTAGTSGLVVAPGIGDDTKFLKGDGTWSVPAYPTKASWNYDDVYTKKTQAIPIIVGPSTDTTAGTWTGTTDAFSSYVDGLTIIYVPAVAGASTTTLNINGLGAKTCHFTNTSKLTTHFAVGTPIMFTYYGGYWKRADYDSNSNAQYYLTLNGVVKGSSGKTNLGTIWAPSALASTGGYILATNSNKTGLEWVAKPVSNVTTSAVVGSSANTTTLISANQTNPYYNLIEGSSVTRSIQFKGEGITSVTSDANGVITINSSGYSNFVKSGSTAAAGLVPKPDTTAGTTKFLCEDGTWKTPTYTSDTDTWREIKVNGTLKRNTDITSGDLDFINGSNTTVEWTSENKLKINSTWTAWSGATDSANGTAGYMPAPTSAQRGQFLRGDGTWVSLNNYSLPKSTTSALGGIIVSNVLTSAVSLTSANGSTANRYYGVLLDKDGKAFVNIPYFAIENLTDWASTTATTASDIAFTKVWWKVAPTSSNKVYGIGIHPTNGLLYYIYNNKGTYTATAYSSTKNSWRNVYVGGSSEVGTGTGTKAINYVAGSNVTITYEAAGTSTGLSGDADYFNIKIAATNTWNAFTAATADAAGTAGYIQAPAGALSKFFRGDNTWLAISLNVTSALYVGASNGTSTTAQTAGNVHLIFAEGSTYNRFKITGSGRASVTSDTNGTITINSSGYSNFTAATDSVAGSAGLVPGPETNILGSGGYFLRADGSWAVPTNTWTAMTGATSSANGTIGYINAVPPKSGYNTKYWRADGTWNVPTNTLYYLTLNNSVKGTSGKTDLGTIYAPTSSGTGFLKSSVSGSTVTWTYDNTTYATPDATTTLTRASGDLTKDTWSDVGTFADGIAEGTWAISFTIDGSLYSGVFSRKKSDTMSEEISLHAAGTSTKRIYARTTGNKIQIVTADDTFNPGAVTFNFRKLI